MEVSKIPAIVLILIGSGILIGVGIIIFDAFGTASATEDAIVQETIKAEKLFDIKMEHGNLTSVQLVQVNNSWNVPANNYTINYSQGTFYLLATNGGVGNNTNVNVSYKFRNYETETKFAMADQISAFGDISGTWLGLIVAIVMLAIVLGLVFHAFVRRGGR